LLRAAVQIQWPGDARLGEGTLRELGRKAGSGGGRLRIGSISEMSADSGFTGPTAYTQNDMPGARDVHAEQLHAGIEADSQTRLTVRYPRHRRTPRSP
jgi:hypothetical protein